MFNYGNPPRPLKTKETLCVVKGEGGGGTLVLDLVCDWHCVYWRQPSLK